LPIFYWQQNGIEGLLLRGKESKTYRARGNGRKGKERSGQKTTIHQHTKSGKKNSLIKAASTYAHKGIVNNRKNGDKKRRSHGVPRKSKKWRA